MINSSLRYCVFNSHRWAVHQFNSDVHANSYPHRGTREGGWNPFPEFLICGSILKRFSLKWKAFDLLNKIRYMALGWWRCWGRRRHKQCSPSWILPRIRNQVKTTRNDNFFVLYMKNNTYISTLHDFSHKIYFYCGEERCVTKLKTAARETKQEQEEYINWTRTIRPRVRTRTRRRRRREDWRERSRSP